MELKPIAIYHGPMPSKFGIPRQSGIVQQLEGYVELCGEYSDGAALKGIDGFEYIWLLWGFSFNREVKEHVTVRPPRLGGNVGIGVFATRSPYRPNPIGLSSVRLLSVEKGKLKVQGADLADGTPIYDIKPYLPYTDSHPDARAGFTDSSAWEKLEVVIPAELAAVIDKMEGQGAADTICGLLAQDPRPRYQDDPGRIYGMTYGCLDIRFNVDGEKLFVKEVVCLKS